MNGILKTVVIVIGFVLYVFVRNKTKWHEVFCLCSLYHRDINFLVIFVNNKAHKYSIIKNQNL